ncbi:MAG: hypothetical protein L0214_07625 [candidate division NC10 bacterium]|nr:hypothetical protein [candidate division NC10 bacterium]
MSEANNMENAGKTDPLGNLLVACCPYECAMTPPHLHSLVPSLGHAMVSRWLAERGEMGDLLLRVVKPEMWRELAARIETLLSGKR